ncbi:hypothetical protein [Ideonella oryzae]|uniref:ABC transporter substrate-binding protein n=1 Tax=Ideonella oryzae TaxID=2937441 RepID=A0ABT1BQ57_9BURK|nr:hypothetical protein [Ideonella oryzae]MCO5978361.1 hypothetical protein [Ideonella oryzae]
MDQPLMTALERELAPLQRQGHHLVLERGGLSPEASDSHSLLQVEQWLARRHWDLVVSTTMSPVAEVRKLDHNIPVLFRSADDPRSYCLVRSLRQPGTPTTGFTSALPGWAKMAEALHLAFPRIRGLTLLVDGTREEFDPDCPGVDMPPCRPGPIPPDELPQALGSSQDDAGLRLAARRAGLPLRYVRFCRREDIGQLKDWLPSGQGVLVPMTYLTYFHREQLVPALQGQGLPVVYDARYFLQAGGLMAVKAISDPPDLPRGIELARRILEGADPAHIPIQRPEGFEFIINLRAARAMGLVPSKAALRTADQLWR